MAFPLVALKMLSLAITIFYTIKRLTKTYKLGDGQTKTMASRDDFLGSV
jgi:hypothetical protein